MKFGTRSRMVGTPSTAAQIDSGPSLADLARECRFTGHKIVATYERKVNTSVFFAPRTSPGETD